MKHNNKITRALTNLDLLMFNNDIKTDKELCKKMNWSSQQNASQKLRGEISMKTMKELSEFFGVTLKDFLR